MKTTKTTKTSGWRLCWALMSGIAALTVGVMAFVSPTPALLTACGIACLNNLIAWNAV